MFDTFSEVLIFLSIIIADNLIGSLSSISSFKIEVRCVDPRA